MSGKSKSKWASIANSVLAESGDEGKAIRIANGLTRGAVGRRMKKRTITGAK